MRLIERYRAISDGPTPAERSYFTFSAFARAFGALPLYLPSALALAMPTIMDQLPLELGDGAER